MKSFLLVFLEDQIHKLLLNQKMEDRNNWEETHQLWAPEQAKQSYLKKHKQAHSKQPIIRPIFPVCKSSLKRSSKNFVKPKENLSAFRNLK